MSATSTLKPTEFDSFGAENCHDLDLSTAWITDPKNHGIGARITYELEARNPRITELIVVNGYTQSTDLWKAYSRVKRLKVYYSGQPYAILHFEDVSREHHFAIGPLGVSDREDYDALGKRPNWQLEFEILEVYPGDEHAATAITEIYFDGIDVH